MELFWIEMSVPVGKFIIFADDKAVTRIELSAKHRPAGKPRPNDILRRAEKQLAEYFSGKREMFDLPLAPTGTEFQMRVWNALAKIPFGQTRTYGQIAKALKKPLAARAVGAACGQNPLSIVIPCHRVVGATGSLTGFGGGLSMKEWLLKHEGALMEG
jgi:methylated-DNA-[protein]-cysteine S-methyltransferase